MSDNIPKVRLRCWEEVVGRLEAVEQKGSELCVLLGKMQVVFPAGSPEAETLLKKLNGDLNGKMIGILKTDDPQNPLLIILIERDLRSDSVLARLWSSSILV